MASTKKGYDRLARVYAWLEYCAFGHLLMRSRKAFVPKLGSPSTLLLLGEGDGRFLKHVLERYPTCRIDCVEQSGKMIELAKKRLKGEALAQVNFYEQDLSTFTPQLKRYDAVMSHFILDSFTKATLEKLIPKLGRGLKPKGFWLYTDFHLPAKGLARYRSQLWLKTMYSFFKWQTGLAVTQLHDPKGLFEQLGLELEAERFFSGRLVVTRLYTKSS